MSLNRKQKIVMWIATLTIIFMGLFPPFRYPVSPEPQRRKGMREIGESPEPINYERTTYYGFLLTDSAADLSFTKLFVQWFIVIALSVTLLITFKTRKSEQS